MTDPQPGGAVARPSRRGSRALGNALLNVAALGGIVCIVLVLLSVFFNISLIMFKTGSMSPTIPAGSLAVVREIPAAQIRVGDVLTVDRPGVLPVTHRVTSVAGEGDARTITMRGDANEAEDPAPYTISKARIVLVSVPNLARAVVWFSNPLVLGGLTLGASALVTWAFWPRQPREPGAAGDVRGAREARGARGVRETRGPRRRRDPQHSGTRSRPRHGASAVAVASVIGASAGMLGLPLGAQPAQATAGSETTEHTRGAITVWTVGDTRAMRTMRPGVPVPWEVGVRVETPDASTVSVSLTAAGSPELGLLLDVRECDARWVRGVCEGTETLVSEQAPIAIAAAPSLIAQLRGNAERWFLITAVIPEPASGTVELTLRAEGGTDAVTVGPGPAKPGPAVPRPPGPGAAGPVGGEHSAGLSLSGALAAAPWALAIAAVAAGLTAAGGARALKAFGREAHE